MIIRLPPMHKSQAAVRDHPARFKVLSCGRRWGKTLLGASLCLAAAIKGGRAWWVAPTYQMGDPGWRALAGMASQIPGAQIRRGDREILIGKQGAVKVRSADAPERLKGDKLHFAVLDECAQIPEAAWMESIRPTLTDYKGKAVFISTPKGRNWFYRLFMYAQSGADPDWAWWQLPTTDNPFIDPKEIEAARGDLPELVFEQEYLAVFLIDEGTVFRNINACLNAPLNFDPQDHQGHTLIGGIDWARFTDFTAISVGCLQCKREVARDRFNKVDYLLQAGRIEEMWRRLGIKAFLAESNAMGLPIIEALQDKGLPIYPFNMDAVSKPQVIRNLSLIFERARWQFQADPTWTTELQVYEQKISPTTGKASYNAPEGFHDDTIIARALMVKAEDYVLTGDLFL